MDFTKYKRSNTFYGGSEKKLGIVVDGHEYMLKFQKKTPFGMRNNHISEYIGSHIFELLGFDVQETYLGTYNGENVVACRNFVSKNQQFVPFNDVGESTLEENKEQYQYEYEDIMQMLVANSKLTEVEATVSAFWQIYIVDALIGNFDRHGGNWGFIKENNQYRLSPVFDNGSCLFPSLTDTEMMKKIMDSKAEIDKRVFGFPTSQIRLNGVKSSYFEVINSLEFEECNKALAEVFTKINMESIENIIDDIEDIEAVQRQFYKRMLSARYEKILKASYDKLMKG